MEKENKRAEEKAPKRVAPPEFLGFMQVGGQVREPGEVTVVEGMTVEEALKAAGGATEFGARNRVTLHRNGEEITIDLNTNKGKAMKVQAYDVLEIPQKMLFGQ